MATKPDMPRRQHTDGYVQVRHKGSQIDWGGHEFKHVDGRIGVQPGYSVGAFLRSCHVPLDEGS